MATPRMQRCFYCGAEIGVMAYAEPFDTCGKPECDREAAAAQRQERDEAHEQLDRDRGWE
jgi:hypothetical protein